MNILFNTRRLLALLGYLSASIFSSSTAKNLKRNDLFHRMLLVGLKLTYVLNSNA